MNMRLPNKNNEQLSDVSPDLRSNPGEVSTQEIQFSELITIFVDSWRLIVGMVLLFVVTGIIYIILARPVYQVDVLLQVEEGSKGIGAMTELTDLLQTESPVTAEFEIMRSRMVIGSVVDNLKLDISASAKHLPFIGAFIASGSESIKVENFDVPVAYQGKLFKLVAVGEGSYNLFDPEGILLTQGVVGKPVKASLANEEFITLFVSELKSKPGITFKLTKIARLTAINKLKQKLNITELGKSSGILRMSLEGTSKGKITSILNEIANIYLRQSVERKSTEAENTLKFLEKQLPILKAKMENAEAALNNYRLQKGSVDLTMETQSTLEKIVSIDAQLTQFRSDREELILQFTPEHPRIASLDGQIANLNRELKKVDSKVKVLPGTQQEILRLTRDMDVSSSLYTSLMNSAQELKIVKAGAVGNVRIVDYAVIPVKPVKPKRGLVIALMLLLGGLLGVGLALIRKSLRGAIEDPDIIEKKLGLPVYATIPYSRKQRKLNGYHRHAKGGQHRGLKQVLLAAVDTDDHAVESLRSLRTSLYFAKLNAKNNMLMVTSSSPDAGKSFLSMNLATVLADTGKRVLVIDADLRKGRIHHLLGVQRRMGLSDLIAGGDMDFSKIIHKTDINNLYVLTVGTIAPNPSELLLQKSFESVMEKLSESFDHVIIDSPPVLAVTDAVIIGSMAGATLLVVRDGQSPIREIEQSMYRLKQAGVNLCGAVFNGMKEANSRYGYGKYYGYSYSYSDKKK